MGGDALGSAAVLVSGIVLLFVPSATWLDPVSALVVAAIIVYEAAGVFRSSVSVLLESTPADVDLNSLAASMVAVPGVAEVHDLHVWSLSSEVRALSAHLVLTGHPTLEEAQVVGREGEAGHRRPLSRSPTAPWSSSVSDATTTMTIPASWTHPSPPPRTGTLTGHSH